MFCTSIRTKLLRVSLGALMLVVSAWGQNPETPPPPKASSGFMLGPIEILSDTQGVNFGPYLTHVIVAIRKNWYSRIPPAAQPPVSKQGNVVIKFAIQKDGKVNGIGYVQESGDADLDGAAYGGIEASSPLPPLPAEFSGSHLDLRFTFKYNPPPADAKTH
jgi:TonB family protein